MRPRLEMIHERVLEPISDLSLRAGVRLPGGNPARIVLRSFAKTTAGRDVTFVQIGSNDGTTGDPLRSFARRYSWSGVLVEPVPYVFRRLDQRRGPEARIRLENAAVTDRDGEEDFYHLRQGARGEDLPSWYDQIGSFSLSTVLQHERDIPGIRDRLITTKVRCLTFDSLCSRHALESIDLLHIDTEGHDWEILRHVDLDRYSPSVILYEHAHLSPQARGDALQRLEHGAYLWMETVYDTIALSQESLLGEPQLTRAWRQAARQAVSSG